MPKSARCSVLSGVITDESSRSDSGVADEALDVPRAGKSASATYRALSAREPFCTRSAKLATGGVTQSRAFNTLGVCCELRSSTAGGGGSEMKRWVADADIDIVSVALVALVFVGATVKLSAIALRALVAASVSGARKHSC